MSTILMQDYNNRLEYLKALKIRELTNQEIERQKVLGNSLNDFRASLPNATLDEAVLPKEDNRYLSKIGLESIVEYMKSRGFVSPLETYSRVLCKDGALKTQNANNLDACRDNGGRAEIFKKVICNDGSIQDLGNNPSGGRNDVPCKNNGGVSKNQESVNGKGKEQTITKKTFLEKHKNHLLLVGALVLGFFAYKKFKK